MVCVVDMAEFGDGATDNRQAAYRCALLSHSTRAIVKYVEEWHENHRGQSATRHRT
jgi:hypothetical protein